MPIALAAALAGRVIAPLAACGAAGLAARAGMGEMGQAVAGAAGHGAPLYGMHEAVQQYQHRQAQKYPQYSR